MLEVAVNFIGGIWTSIQSDPMIRLCFWCTLALCALFLIMSVLSRKESKISVVNWFSTTDNSQLRSRLSVSFTRWSILMSKMPTLSATALLFFSAA